MKNHRFYLAPISGTRRSHQTWIQFGHNPSITSIYRHSLRRVYRRLRKSGMGPMQARFAMYDIVALGLSSKRCDNYGADR
jgi:hypothetical protein